MPVVPGLDRPLSAAEYGARYGLPPDEVVALVRRGVVAGEKSGGVWYAEDAPPPDRLAAIGAREAAGRDAAARAAEIEAAYAPRFYGLGKPALRILADTPSRFHLHLTPRWGGLEFLGWLVFLVIGVLMAPVVIRDAPVFAAVIGGVWAVVFGGELVWNLRGWEETVLTPDRCYIRRRNVLTRTCLDVPLEEVASFEVRTGLRQRGDTRTLSAVSTTGRREYFGPGVRDARVVAALLDERLRRLKGAP